MKTIAQNFKGHYREIILGPLFKLFEAVLELLVPLVMAGIIDVGIGNADKAYVLRGGLLLLGIAALSVAAAITCQYYAATAAGHFGRSLRSQVYRHVLSLSSGDTARFGAGGLITRVTNDVNQMQNGVNMAIRLGTRAPFLAFGSIGMALALNWRIGLVFLAATPLILLAIYAVMKRTLPSYTRIQAGQDALSRLSREGLEGARVIRAFSRQKREKQEFDAAADDLTVLLVRVGKISAVLNPATTLIVNIAIIAIVWLGANFAFGGAIQPGEIIALVSYMNQTLLALIVAANLIILFTRAVASTRRVAEVLNTAPSITGGPGAEGKPGAPAIRFNDVSFAYHKGAGNALEHLSFRLMPGETLGVIGGTGSGKTTLANLLVRYYDATKGEVQVNGAPVQSYTLAQLHSKIGLVPQNVALFNGTVRHNLLVSGQEATDEELWHALAVAQGKDFVAALPEQLDTLIVEGGKNLSGGQKQRLTIARALVRRPEILILDDSSSALDYATDAALRHALQQDAAQNAPGRTTVLISQRAATIRHADLILVLDEGRLAGSGRHEELLETSEVYREICVSQGLVPTEGQVV